MLLVGPNHPNEGRRSSSIRLTGINKGHVAMLFTHSWHCNSVNTSGDDSSAWPGLLAIHALSASKAQNEVHCGPFKDPGSRCFPSPVRPKTPHRRQPINIAKR